MSAGEKFRSTNGKLYWILNDNGKISPTLKRLLREGKLDLIKGSNYVYNTETRRVFPRSKFVTRSGDLRSRFSTAGFYLDDENPNVLRLRLVSAAKHFKDPQYANDYVAKGKTMLDKINADPDAVKQKIEQMKKDGRVEIESRQELEAFPLGSLVSYITKDGKYRSGGFLRSLSDDRYFALQGGTARQPISFSVQYKNVAKMYVKPGHAFVESARLPRAQITPTERPPTKFPVHIGETIVYYARDGFAKRRFMDSGKYKAMLATYERSRGSEAA